MSEPEMRIYGKKVTAAEASAFVTDYYKDAFRNKRSRYYQMRDLLPRSGKVLDFGCGWGLVSKFMVSEGRTCDVHAIDYSENEINISRSVWGAEKGIRFEVKDIRNLPDETYDCVLSSQVIEHTHNPGNYLKQCARVLKKDGTLLIALPNVMNPRFMFFNAWTTVPKLKRLSERLLKGYDKTHDHIQAWDSIHFTQFLASCGFLLEDFRPLEGIPLPFGYLRWKLPFLWKWSYTMIFVARKAKTVDIKNED